MKEVMMHASSTYQKYIRMYDDKSIGNHDALEPVIKYREVEQTAAPAASPLGLLRNIRSHLPRWKFAFAGGRRWTRRANAARSI